MEQKNVSNDDPLDDMVHLKNSTKRKDLQAIIAIDPQKLTVNQKKQANRLGLLTLVAAPLFERAKMALQMYGCDVSKLLQTGQYDGLSEVEVKALQKSAADKLRSLKKKGLEENKNEVGPANDTLRLGQMINNFFNEFNLNPCLACLKRQNQLNNVAFYQFVLSLPKCPIPSFLQMLSDVIASEDRVDQKLRLFHAFCGLYDGEWIGNFDGLCIPAVEYLASTEQAMDRHAQGFLRYAFVNGVDLDCGSRVAAIFDDKFSHVWLQLGVSLWSNLYDQSMFNSLPSTIMVMRQPMIQALKSSSLAAIPPIFFRVALGILTYTCTSDEGLFQQLLFQFNEPLNKNYMKAETTSLLTLCLYLEKEMVASNKLWCAQPLAVISFLKNALEMIRLDKVPGGMFTCDVCEMLLSAGTAAIDCLKRPSYKKHVKIEEDAFIDDIVTLNSSSKETASALRLLGNEQMRIDLILLEHLRLLPSPVQGVCIKLLQLNTRAFLCPSTGTGKTTLMNALAVEGASQGNQVLIVNPFSDLLFKDYVAVRDLVQQMKLNFEVQLLSNQGEVISRVCFLTFAQLLQVKLPQIYHLIIDEFQEEFYCERVFALFNIFRKAASVVAFSGSPIRKEHTLFLQCVLSQSLVVSFPDIYPNTLREEVPYICLNMQAQINQLLKEAEKYRVNAPVIVIGSEELATKYINKVALKRKAGTHLLFGEHCNPAELDQLLTIQNFCATNGGHHKVHFVLKEGGVGIDYPSTTAINNAGGNVVIICIKPTSYSQLCQFKRRTARMGAPGTVLYILVGNGSGEDPNYLQALEGTLKENDLQNVLRLSSKIRSVDYQEVEQYQGQVLFNLKESVDSDEDEDMEEDDSSEDEEKLKIQAQHQQVLQHITLDAIEVEILLSKCGLQFQQLDTILKALEQYNLIMYDDIGLTVQLIKKLGALSKINETTVDDLEEADKKPVEQIHPKGNSKQKLAEMIQQKVQQQEFDKKPLENKQMATESQKKEEIKLEGKILDQEMKPEAELKTVATPQPPTIKPLDQKALFQHPSSIIESGDMITMKVTEEHSILQFPDGLTQQTTKRTYQQTIKAQMVKADTPIVARKKREKKKEEKEEKEEKSGSAQEEAEKQAGTTELRRSGRNKNESE